MELKEIEERMLAIRVELDNEESDVDALEKEVEDLTKRKKEILDKAEKRSKTLAAIIEGSKGVVVEQMEERKKDDEIQKTYKEAFLKNLRGIELNEVEKRAFNTAGVVGTIPTEIADEVIKKAKDQAPLLNEITLLNIEGNVKYAVEGTKVNANNHTENASITSGSDTLVPVELSAYEVTKLMQISQNVKTMSSKAFEEWLTGYLVEMVIDKIVGLIIKGTGTSQAKGITANTYDTTNSIEIAADEDITVDNVLDLLSKLKAGYSKNAKVLMNNVTLLKSIFPLQDNAKNSLVTCLNGEFYLLGKKIMVTDDLATNEIYVGDFKKYVGNMSTQISVKSAFDINTNSYKYLGAAAFDGKLAIKEAFVKLSKAAAPQS